ncbi:hypothetical protein ACFQY0_12770 [Haloferula chungangensis]|uniref:Glycosyltransferase n=1 Tax=Haloferula chungangensis TaxID=1048331 RepID=A0ABW2L6M6_9BACT
MSDAKIALVLLSHERAERVNRMVDRWRSITRPYLIVVAFGGDASEFESIKGRKVFVDDSRLRTTDHQRERQSYTEVLRKSVQSIADDDWDALYLAEFDMLPIVSDLWKRLEQRAEAENADLLGHRVWRVDGTFHPHYSNLATAPEWFEWIRTFSIREESAVVLSCMGCGQRWRREAIQAVVDIGEPVRAYLELHLPTAAHHLGYRVRGLSDQDQFVSSDQLATSAIPSMKQNGAWVVHPVKGEWA